MKIRIAIATASAVALIGGGTALALAIPAAASPSGASHTLKFIAEQTNTVTFTKASEGLQQKDLNAKGKLIGFDQLNVVFNFKTGKGLGSVALDVSGGQLFGELILTSSPTTHGTVTGGVGIFKGASGTIVGKSLNKAGTKTAVTVTYHT
jgi:hypothetical protein